MSFAGEDGDKVASYSLLSQKQSGSMGSDFHSLIKFPDNYKIAWKYPEEAIQSENAVESDFKLDVDKFIAIVFSQ